MRDGVREFFFATVCVRDRGKNKKEYNSESLRRSAIVVHGPLKIAVRVVRVAFDLSTYCKRRRTFYVSTMVVICTYEKFIRFCLPFTLCVCVGCKNFGFYRETVLENRYRCFRFLKSVNTH